MDTTLAAPKTYEKYKVTVDEYLRFKTQGYIVVRGLVPPEDVHALNSQMDNLLAGRETIEGALIMGDLGRKPRPMTPEDWLRAHMLHRQSPIHERTLLHPRMLDVLEALIGPDVLALQSMLFFKQPGQPGQGYHQDSYYITTYPDTLCGAWLALTKADQENGCLWFSVGSQNEPVYPSASGQALGMHSNLGDLGHIENPSDTNTVVNTLTPIARRYQEVPVEAEPGDVVFFGGHIIHRSHTNHSDRSRRSFVGHYCNARSWVPWNHGDPFEGGSANYLHILARGETHLPYAQPRFGTPCAANQPKPVQGSGAARPMSMMPDDTGMMTMTMHSDKDDEG